MTKTNWLSGPPLLAAALAGCASIPDTDITYYLPKATVTLTLLQTLQCSAGTPGQLIAAYSVTSTTAFARDVSRGPRHISLSDLDGVYSDVDLKFGLTEDGRLLSVNASSTGQGEAIATSAVSLLGSIIGIAAAPGPLAAPAPARAATVCDVLKDWAGAGKAVTLNYVATIPFKDGKPEVAAAFVPQAGSDVLLAKLVAAGGVPTARITVVAPQTPALPAPAPAARGVISVPRTAPVTIEVHVVSGPSLEPVPVWAHDVVIPIDGEIALPIGRSAAFGKQGFELALGDSGAPTSVRYTKSTGLASAMNAANTALGPLQPKSVADQTAAINAQSDLIAAQQRLVRCKAGLDGC